MKITRFDQNLNTREMGESDLWLWKSQWLAGNVPCAASEVQLDFIDIQASVQGGHSQNKKGREGGVRLQRFDERDSPLI